MSVDYTIETVKPMPAPLSISLIALQLLAEATQIVLLSPCICSAHNNVNTESFLYHFKLQLLLSGTNVWGSR